jgi:hypothetical protein
VRLTRFRRLLVVLALAPMALGGAFGHVDGFERLSHGTFLFPPDHPAHAPFVPEKEHPCAACAIASLVAPAATPNFLVPPEVRRAVEICAERTTPFAPAPELPARAPPVSPAV